MSVQVWLDDESLGRAKIEARDSSYTLHYPCESLTDCTYYHVLLPENRYLFEVWGAEGGSLGGKGGYTKGILRLNEPTEINVFLGAQGPTLSDVTTIVPPAYNGGGSGGVGGRDRKGGSGGGGSDIRVSGITFEHRILVAGGGGGGNEITSPIEKSRGGFGGGEEGSPGDKSKNDLIAQGGTQESAGIGTDEYNGTASAATHSGLFGLGGCAFIISTCGGGGGGWYGGAGSPPAYHGGGGGGSGYVLTAASFKPSGYQHGDHTTYYFTSGVTKAGNLPFPSCTDPKSIEVGHSGSGCARITVLIRSTCKAPMKFNFTQILSFMCAIFISK